MGSRRSVLTALGFALALLVAWVDPAVAQGTGRVTGLVTDRTTGEPLAGVSVYLDGTTFNVTTGENGRYLLPAVPAGTYTVMAKLVGYADAQRAAVSVSAGGTVTVNLIMSTEAVVLQELVATGVVDPIDGKKLPMVIGKLSGENLTAVPTTSSALAMLQGRMAGVQVLRAGGQPGTGVYMQIRTPTTILGSDSPLYVVDGVILGTGTQDIEALDIESIEVIKGAAAASLYGSRAAAGVVQITTRRGSNLSVGTTRISSRTEYGFSQLPDRRPSLTHRHRFLINKGEAYVDTAGNTVNPGDYITADGTKAIRRNQRIADPRDVVDHEHPAGTKIYDNLGALFQPGKFLTNTVSLSQNFEKTNYMVGFTMYDEAGALANNTGLQRYNGKFNLDHRFSDKLVLSMNAQHTRSHSDDLSGSPFSTLLYYEPTINLAAKDSAGNYLQFPDEDWASENPIWRQATRENWTKRQRTLAGATVRYSPFRWLRFIGTLSYDLSNIDDQIYVPMGIPQSPGEENPTEGRVAYSNAHRDATNGSFMATFNRSFGYFNPRITFGGTFETNDYKYFSADARNYVVKNLKGFNLARQRDIMSSSLSEERANGLLLDMATDYADKYIFSFVARRDGSSRFGPDRRWHNFYSGRVAWRMAFESWWPFPDAITDFKPFLAIGTAGGRPTFAQQYETWSVSIPQDAAPTFSRGNAGNPELSPERTQEREIGLDLTLFRNHDISFAYVTQKTTGLILQGVGPAAEGYFSKWENIGGQSGTTIELEYEGRLINTRDFSWNSTLVLDRSNSWISYWDRPAYQASSGYKWMGTEGTLYDIWGRNFLTSKDQLLSKGRIPEEYHNQFDVNDDGLVVWVGEGNTWRSGWDGGPGGAKLWGTSRQIDGITYYWGMPVVERTANKDIAFVKIGTSRPDFNYGWMNNIRYKNFNAHIHFRGQLGGNIYSAAKQNLYVNRRHADVDQHGKPENEKKPSAYYVSSTGLNQSYNSYFITDGTFLKLSALSVNYRFTQDQLSSVFGNQAPRSLTLGINGRNVMTWTSYDGWDPDVGTPTTRMDGVNNYPNMRQWTLMAEISF